MRTQTGFRGNSDYGSMDGSTGDLKNNLMKLIKEVRRMKLRVDVNIQGLASGCPNSFLLLLHASLMSYSLPLANWLTTHNYDLYSKNDLRFLQELYRLLRDMFNYKPKLSKEQFLSSSGFAERKILLTTHVLLICQAKHSQLQVECFKKKRTSNHVKSAELGTKSHDIQQQHSMEDLSSSMCVTMAISNSSMDTSESGHTHSVPTPVISVVREIPSLVVQRHEPPFQLMPTKTPKIESQLPEVESSVSVCVVKDVSYQTDALRETVEKMSAKLVLLETQLKVTNSREETLSIRQSHRKEGDNSPERTHVHCQCKQKMTIATPPNRLSAGVVSTPVISSSQDESARTLIESLRRRAKKTKEFLQQVNFSPQNTQKSI